jgi:hypothetical protein
MKRLLLPGLVLALFGPAAFAGGPCGQPCLIPYQLERKLVTCYRTETRTEIRAVPRTVYRTVPETVNETIEEKVLVPYWREEERTRDVMVIEHKEEKRPCSALVVGSEDEKRTRTLMVPTTQEETRQALTYDLRTVPELKKTVVAAPVILPPCCGCLGGLDAIAQQLAHSCVTREIVYHLVPELREVPYKVTTEFFNEKVEMETVPVPTFREAPPVTVPVCEYTPRVERERVKVLDFREETRTHTVPVTVYRRKAETVLEEAPCTVEVQVPYQKEVWVPVCPPAPR